MDIHNLILSLNQLVLGWPFLLFVVGVSVLCTIAFSFIQIRAFMAMWRYTFAPSDQARSGDMTPMQAFITTLNSNLGNGSIGGVATALFAGGPGSALWLVVISFFLMSVRFAEVFLSTYYAQTKLPTDTFGGPMLYLKQVVGGKQLAWLYGVLCLIFGLVGGNAIQTNTIQLSINKSWGFPPVAIAIVIFFFVLYVVTGGAQRIAKVSEALVPIKVFVFSIATFILLAYHATSIIPALRLIWASAFSSKAIMGGAMGYAVQQAVKFGTLRSIFATESGLGTAAIIFGSTGSILPIKDGVMSMLSTFISTIVCFVVALCIVASGALSSGLTSTALTIASFQTVFGWMSGWIVSFLSVTFGAGVLVSYAYIAREAWIAIMGEHNKAWFTVVYCIVAFLGALVAVEVIWNLVDLVMAAMLIINLYAIAYLIPVIRNYLKQHSSF